MKSLLCTVLVVMLAVSAFAADVTLQWDPNTEPDLAGYKVYYGTVSGDYGAPVPVPVMESPSHVIENLQDNIMYYFVVTAFDTENLESDYSNEVSCMKNIKPATVINININCR